MTRDIARIHTHRRVGVFVAVVVVAFVCVFSVVRAEHAPIRWQLTTLRSVSTSPTTDGGYARDVSFTLHALDLTYDVRASINEGVVGVNFSAKRQLSPERRRRLLSSSSDVEVTEIAADAFEVVPENAPRSATRCQYSGVVENVATTTSVAVALCDNFIKGQIIAPSASLSFSQVSDADAETYLASVTLPAGLDPLEYVVLNVTTFEAHEDGAIDAPIVVNSPGFKDLAGNIVDASLVDQALPSTKSMSGRKLLVSSAPRYLEVIAVNDKARCDQFNGDVDALEADTLFVMNVANSLYASAFSPSMTIVLRDIISFTTSDPYTVSTDSEVIIQNINTWRATNYDSLTTHDVVHLLSGLNFDGATIGLAWQYSKRESTSACDQGQYCSSVGLDYCAVKDQKILGCCLGTAAISQVWKRNSQRDAITVAHEIGHQLGFSHDNVDGDGCAASENIMSTTATLEAEVDWSTCTSAEYLAKIDSEYHTCLLAADTTATSVCGNGIVEAGEDCDCPDNNCECYDGCCDGATCKLNAGAECSAVDGCCDDSTCKIKPANTVCRAAESSCDVQEVCDGTSKSCPADSYLAYGTACVDSNGDRGSCWSNECRNRDFQCQRVSNYVNGGILFGGARASAACLAPYSIGLSTSCSYENQPWYCFANNYECNATVSYYPSLHAPRGFPCSTEINGAYPSVCDGLGSCATLSSIMPKHVAPLAEPSTQRVRNCTKYPITSAITSASSSAAPALMRFGAFILFISFATLLSVFL